MVINPSPKPPEIGSRYLRTVFSLLRKTIPIVEGNYFPPSEPEGGKCKLQHQTLFAGDYMGVER